MGCEHKCTTVLDKIEKGMIGDPPFGTEVWTYRKCDDCSAVNIEKKLVALNGQTIYRGVERLNESMDTARSALEAMSACLKYCRFCGARNYNLMPYCYKCGKKIGEYENIHQKTLDAIMESVDTYALGLS